MHLVERLKYLVHNNIVFVLLSRLEWNYADLNVSNALIVILFLIGDHRHFYLFIAFFFFSKIIDTISILFDD